MQFSRPVPDYIAQWTGQPYQDYSVDPNWMRNLLAARWAAVRTPPGGGQGGASAL